MKHQTNDLYERITNQIVEAIERGVKNWRMPWHITDAEQFAPMNVVSKKPYRGLNILTLWSVAEEFGYESGLWGTYKQWKSLGAQV
jgi:antirestriction protein ArdC